MTVVRCSGVEVKHRRKDVVDLAQSGPRQNVKIAIENLPAQLIANIPDRLDDLLTIAAYIYAADQAVSRGSKVDLGTRWRRRFRFHVPVRALSVWTSPEVNGALCDALAEMSEDRYEFRFTQQTSVRSGQMYVPGISPLQAVDEVMLFSGGLDSLAGALHELSEGRKIALVSHSSATKRVPLVQDLVARLRNRPGGDSIAHIPVIATKADVIRAEFTQRTRSFLYASLAMTVAAIARRDRIRFYENGVTSMNLPLAAQVVGARSTRTTHPKVMAAFGTFFSHLLGRPFTVETPFFRKTKTDIIRTIREHNGMDLIARTISCSRTIDSSTAHPHCGRCSQCVDRRFATAAAGLPDEYDPAARYRVDLFTGEREAGETRTMVESFVQRARRLSTLSVADFLASCPEASRALRFMPMPPDDGLAFLTDLHRRHGNDVVQALDAALRRHDAELRSGALSDTCLLAMAFPERYHEKGAHKDPTKPVFERQGDGWRVQFNNDSTWVKDTVGLGYLIRLIGSPSAVFSAVALAGPDAGTAPPKRSQIQMEVSDPTALKAYKARIEDLKEMAEVARGNGNPDEAMQADEERRRIEDALRKMTGLGGRSRKVVDEEERARFSVTKAIQRTINQLGKNHRTLALHLRSSVTLGSLCSYVPNAILRKG